MPRFDWQLKFLSVHACRPREKGDGLEALPLARMNSFSEEEEILEKLIDGQLIAAFSKRPDTGPTSACKAYSFMHAGRGLADKQLVTRAIEATTLDEFEEIASDLAARYADLDNARPALTVFMQSQVTTATDSMLSFFVMLACDFEEVSVLSGQSTGILEKIGEAVVHRLRKALIYPLTDAGIQHMDRLILFQASAAEGFDGLLSLEPPVCTPELFAGELRQALERRVKEPPAYERYFQEPPPATRKLFGEERYVRLEHLLPSDEVKHVSDLTFHGSKDKFDKELKLRVKVGDFGRFEASMDRFNRDFFFAQRGEEKFLIVRADDFSTRDQITPVEFMDVEDLEQVLRRVLE